MNQLVKNFDEALSGMEVKVPKQIAELVEANINQARTAFETAIETCKSYGEAANSAVSKQQILARELGNHLVENAKTNIGATLDVAQALARSRSLQDVIKIQTSFAQEQTSRLVNQASACMSLALRFGNEAFASWTVAWPSRAQ